MLWSPTKKLLGYPSKMNGEKCELNNNLEDISPSPTSTPPSSLTTRKPKMHCPSIRYIGEDNKVMDILIDNLD